MLNLLLKTNLPISQMWYIDINWHNSHKCYIREYIISILSPYMKLQFKIITRDLPCKTDGELYEDSSLKSNS